MDTLTWADVLKIVLAAASVSVAVAMPLLIAFWRYSRAEAAWQANIARVVKTHAQSMEEHKIEYRQHVKQSRADLHTIIESVTKVAKNGAVSNQRLENHDRRIGTLEET